MSNLIAIDYGIITPKMEKYLEQGGMPGRYLGYECIDKHYSHKDGGVTDWTGFPGSGKTYMALQLLLNLSVKYGLRHCLFVPDIGSYQEILAKLLKMVTGKDMSDRYGNKLEHTLMLRELEWIKYHFHILQKKDIKKGIDPLDFWEYVCNFKDDSPTPILHTGLMDSWKNLEHIYSGREDVYLDRTLSIRNELAEEYQKHFHTIAHAVKTEMEKDGQGKRRIPTAWDIKGGGSWYANGKSIVSVDFPNKKMYGVDLYFSKVKPEDVGMVGNVINTMKLDPKRGQYYEVYKHQNCFAFEAKQKAIDEPELEFGVMPDISVEQDDNKAELPF